MPSFVALYNEILSSFNGPEVQTRILSLLQAHAKLEKHHGEEIYPARREPRMNTRYEQAEQRESEP
jgi:hypothetical protein